MNDAAIPPQTDGQAAIAAAWRLAATAHAGQTYGAERFPYLYHVGLVALELEPGLRADPTLDADFATLCAVLHDVIEDSPATRDDIAARFGDRVADGVLALSKNPSLPASEQLRDSVERIRRQPREVWLVKLADRIANMSKPKSHWSRERALAYADDGQMIRDRLGDASPLLAARLDDRIAAWRSAPDARFPHALE